MVPSRLLLALLFAPVATPALAQDDPPGRSDTASLPADAADRNSFTVGGGVGFVPSYEGSDDYVVIPAAVVRGQIDGFNFSSRGLQLTLDLVRGPKPQGLDLQFGPAVALNLNRTNRLVDRQVRLLGKRAVAFEAGGYAGISKTGVITSAFDTLGARVTVLADTTGVHKSYTITPSVEYGTPLSRKAYVGISLSGTWVGDGYARTYFGVDAAGAARSGLPAFTSPRGGFKNYTVGALGNYAVTGDLLHGLSLFATGSYSRLQGDFARSPIVSVAGSPNQFFGAVGLAYTF